MDGGGGENAVLERVGEKNVIEVEVEGQMGF